MAPSRASEASGRRKRKVGRDSEEERKLEEDLFGVSGGPIAPSPDAFLEGSVGGGGGTSDVGTRRKVKWEDADEDVLRVDLESGPSRSRKLRKDLDEIDVSGTEYVERLRKYHAKLHGPSASWAQLPDRREEEVEGVSQLMQSAKDLLRRPRLLPSGCIEATRMRDANLEDPCRSVLRSLEFHPSGTILMTAGLDKRLRFFQADGVQNRKLESLHFEDLPIHKAAFSQDGGQVVITGRRKFFYIYDVAVSKAEYVSGIQGREEKSLENFAMSRGSIEPTVAFLGSCGYVPLVSLKTKQWMGNLKMNSPARAAAFVPGKDELLTAGVDGLVYIWDLRTRRCRGTVTDEGSFKCTSLNCSSNGLVATGSDSGIVNVYSRNGQAVDLQKSIYNLTTRCDSMVFNHDNQILAIASSRKKDALKLVHLPSCTVFSNWPTSKTPLNFVHSVAFSSCSGFLAVGNARGAALLYRLHHFETV